MTWDFSPLILAVLSGVEATKKLLKTSNFQSLTRKPSYSSFFSVLCPDLKNVFFEKKSLSPFFPSLRSRGHFRGRGGQILDLIIFLKVFIYNFCCFQFRWNLNLDLCSTSETSEGAQGFFFKNYIFEISVFQQKRWSMSQLFSRNFC